MRVNDVPPNKTTVEDWNRARKTLEHYARKVYEAQEAHEECPGIIRGEEACQ